MDTKLLLKYTLWAEQKIQEMLHSLDDQQFAQTWKGNSKSFQSIYTHKVRDMKLWIALLKDETFDEDSYKDVSREQVIQDLFQSLHELENIAKNSPKKIFTLQWGKNAPKFELNSEEVIFNIINHQTYHRGQLALGLGQFNITVNATDYALYKEDTA